MYDSFWNYIVISSMLMQVQYTVVCTIVCTVWCVHGHDVVCVWCVLLCVLCGV